MTRRVKKGGEIFGNFYRMACRKLNSLLIRMEGGKLLKIKKKLNEQSNLQGGEGRGDAVSPEGSDTRGGKSHQCV